MLRSVVCDAGGVLAVSGALDGVVPRDAEFLALDWSAVTVDRFLAARHEGHRDLIEVEIRLALASVHEWFPVRTIVAQTLNRAGLDALDSWSALILAEQLALPLFTASDDAVSSRGPMIQRARRTGLRSGSSPTTTSWNGGLSTSSPPTDP